MEQALQGWRDFYHIEEEAYTQLHSLLHSFGIPIQFVHSTDGGHGHRSLPELCMVDPSLFNTGPPESGTTSSRYSTEALSALFELGIPTRGSPNQHISAGPFESATRNQGYRNQGLSVDLSESGITNEGFLDKGRSIGLFGVGTSSRGSSNQGLGHWQNSNSSVYTSGLEFLAFTHKNFSTESPQQGKSIPSDQPCNTTAEDFQSAALTAPQSMLESSSRPRPCIRCWKRKLRVHPISLFNGT